ncbi:MAG: mandelate racemase/muconate lactonizing enzyme family protein [Albidovulum sp.]|nr:mandelate racemase/muconate lactonizing enzyme family protein [Albidovulum sp.]MDE0303398.1 mandelate racemase/muconate lactonizing enzyme family protein [Albidovulum sp.]MDE0532525.1 mandelate racemase/muconate lactonizing enzyme family protein [Albidovulum sp.]
MEFDSVKSIVPFSLTLPREKPYLGTLRKGEEPNASGYFVRRGNGTVYPVFDRSVLVRIETRSGIVGWGETYGLVAPGAVGEIINDLLAEFIVGRDPTDPAAIYDDLYGLLRVRGYGGGFFADALAAIDIALWDVAGRIAGCSVANLLGSAVRQTIPAYVSGLPEDSLEKRAELAKSWLVRGFDSFKFALPMADDGPKAEMSALRSALGEKARIAVDMHWSHTAAQATELIEYMAPCGLWFAEAPVWTEDIEGLSRVCRDSAVPIAVGEEWRTVYDMRHRIERCRIAIVQPEMGHKGITNFSRIHDCAAERGIEVIPHATIGLGIFLAASLLASAAMPRVTAHEFQHSIFEPNRRLVLGDMDCVAGSYSIPTGPGLGTEPSPEAVAQMVPMGKGAASLARRN